MTLYWINAFCNLIIAISMILFYIVLYGNANSMVYGIRKLEGLFLKFALIFTTCAASWNFWWFIGQKSAHSAIEHVPDGHILMNAGLALVFTYGVWLHKVYFIGSRARSNDRFFFKEQYWWFRTREGTIEGPYNSKDEAKQGLREFIKNNS